MAGEKIGKIDEAVICATLESLYKNKSLTGQIFWNETPNCLSSEPDFVIGSNLEMPQMVVLVTHFGAAGENHKKSWRTIGEMCEIKTSFSNNPLVFTIVFDAQMRGAIKAIQKASFDGQLVIGDLPYGKELQDYLLERIDMFPSDNIGKVEQIRRLELYDRRFRILVKKLENDYYGNTTADV